MTSSSVDSPSSSPMKKRIKNEVPDERRSSTSTFDVYAPKRPAVRKLSTVFEIESDSEDVDSGHERSPMEEARHCDATNEAMSDERSSVEEAVHSDDTDEAMSDVEEEFDTEVSTAHSLFRDQWPFIDSNRSKGYKATTSVRKLLNPDMDCVCDSVPQRCNQAATFIVDVTKLRKPLDISGDDNGSFKKPSVVKDYISMAGTVHTVSENDNYDYLLKRRFYQHKGTSTFRRTVYELYDQGGQQLKYSMLQYYFVDGIEKDLHYCPHGNSKSTKPFMPRTHGTREKIKELSKNLPPSRVVAALQNEEGGAENLSSISRTVRNNDQVYNLKRNMSDAHRSRSGAAKKTDFTNMFKLSQKGDFVKSFELKGDHPRAFCATDQQMRDLEHACTGPNASVLQIDGTFSVGAFYLTCTAYRSRQFQNKNQKMTLMPGPYMIHACRTEEDYEFFARNLSTGLKHKPVPFCGTDGEKAIENGFRRAKSFEDSHWLLCMIHSRDNCKRKLEKLGVRKGAKEKILNDVYGYEVDRKGTYIRQAGLVDLEADEFDTELEKKGRIWDELESADTGKPPVFKSWFVQFKATECKECMAPGLRTKAGLGDPPRQFTTNDVESENNNIKREMDWAKKTWDDAANHLHSRVLAHYEELSRAIYGEGRFSLVESFKDLEKEPYEWSSMTVAERRDHLRKANLTMPQRENSLSILPEETCIQGFSVGDLKAVWESAGEFLSLENGIVHNPRDAATVIVFDDDHNVYTVRKDGHRFMCERKCEKYEYFDHLFCQHTLAVADTYEPGGLQNFVSWINSSIARKSATLLNVSLNATCTGSGEKKTKRKGKNNRLAKEVEVLKPCTSTSTSKASVPASSSVLPSGLGNVCAVNKFDLPPLTRIQKAMQDTQPFSVTFRQGLINRCRGCTQLFSERSKSAPHDLILKKLDFKEYPKDGLWYRASTMAATYYHLNMNCVRRTFPLTEVQDILLYTEVAKSLSPGHVRVLQNFGIKVYK